MRTSALLHADGLSRGLCVWHDSKGCLHLRKAGVRREIEKSNSPFSSMLLLPRRVGLEHYCTIGQNHKASLVLYIQHIAAWSLWNVTLYNHRLWRKVTWLDRLYHTQNWTLHCTHWWDVVVMEEQQKASYWNHFGCKLQVFKILFRTQHFYSLTSVVTELLFCGANFPPISPVYRSKNTAGCKLRFRKREKVIS